MAQNTFAPTISRREVDAVATTNTKDSLSIWLLRAVRYLVTGFACVLPLFFLPGLWATLGFQKALLALTVIAASVTFLSLLALRHSRVYSVVPMTWLSFVGFVAVALVSALFSDSPTTALRGSVLETGTVSFFAIMAGVMLLPLVFQQSKKSTLRVLQALLVGGTVLITYVFARLLFGPILSFGSFTDVTVTPIGSFNDLAIFTSLLVLVSLIMLLQLPLRMGMQVVLAGLITVSLLILAVVNFFFSWLVIGFFGLVVLLYVVSRDRLFSQVDDAELQPDEPSKVLVGVAIVICAVSAWFIVMSDFAGSSVSRLFDVSYLEVRPSLTATVDIAREVYNDQFLLGTGPNQFVSGWRTFKDASINDTIFWTTDFVSGSGFVSTIAVTTGVLGLAAFLLFQGLYLLFGFRTLLATRSQDRFWYFIGVVTFSGAVFLWGMSYIYVPGAGILLLAAFLTGLSFVAGAALSPERVRAIPLVITQQRGFGLMALAILVITSSVGVLFTVGEQYIAHSNFNRDQARASSIAEVDQIAAAAYSQYADDDFLYVRTQAAILEMNQLLNTPEPTEVDQQRFIDVSGRAIAVADQSIAVSPHDPRHHAALAVIYNNLAIAGFEDALERSVASLGEAKRLDPVNPVYALTEAQLAVGRGDVESARLAIADALRLKRNYTEALFLLTQLDIAAGDVAAAIANTEAIVALEPRNPTRYYQLGILYTSAGDSEDALAAYTAAITLDPNYANARYLRALILAENGDTDSALSELRIVSETNEGNEQLEVLIEQLTEGQIPSSSETDEDIGTPVVADPEPSAAEDGTVTSPVAPDSDLITPLNTVPAENSEDETTTVNENANEASAEEGQ